MTERLKIHPITPGDGDPFHGTTTGWNTCKCHCDLCLNWFKAYTAELKLRKSLPGYVVTPRRNRKKMSPLALAKHTIALAEKSNAHSKAAMAAKRAVTSRRRDAAVTAAHSIVLDGAGDVRRPFFIIRETAKVPEPVAEVKPAPAPIQPAPLDELVTWAVVEDSTAVTTADLKKILDELAIPEGPVAQEDMEVALELFRERQGK